MENPRPVLGSRDDGLILPKRHLPFRRGRNLGLSRLIQFSSVTSRKPLDRGRQRLARRAYQAAITGQKFKLQAKLGQAGSSWVKQGLWSQSGQTWR